MQEKETLQEQEEPFDLKKEIFEWVKIIIAAAAIAFCLNTFIIANSTVPSGSMEGCYELSREVDRMIERYLDLSENN